jgi:microcystin degradation protein MlrC
MAWLDRATARLVNGNVGVLVSSIRAQTFDAEVSLLHGIDDRRYLLFALKSTQHFRAGVMPLVGPSSAPIPPAPPSATSPANPTTGSRGRSGPWTRRRRGRRSRDGGPSAIKFD